MLARRCLELQPIVDDSMRYLDVALRIRDGQARAAHVCPQQAFWWRYPIGGRAPREEGRLGCRADPT
jgi:hypothetical protein